MLRNRRQPMIPSIQELEKLERTGLYDVAAVKHEIFSDSIPKISESAAVERKTLWEEHLQKMHG